MNGSAWIGNITCSILVNCIRFSASKWTFKTKAPVLYDNS